MAAVKASFISSLIGFLMNTDTGRRPVSGEISGRKLPCKAKDGSSTALHAGRVAGPGKLDGRLLTCSFSTRFGTSLHVHSA